MSATATTPTGMADSKVRVMARLEDEHWWFQAKRDLVSEALNSIPGGRVLDIGCGTGAMMARLVADGHAPVVGTDLSPVALDAARRRGLSVLRSVAEDLPFRDNSAAVLVSLDVVEHLDDDVLALREYRRVLVPGGVVVLTVPAYDWAWSDHDVALGHRRRYTRARLTEAVEAVGLTVEHVAHFHSWLAPVAYLLRRTPLRRLVKGDEEEVSQGGPVVNRLLGRAAALERRLGRHRSIPVGLSILLVGRRPPDR